MDEKSPRTLKVNGNLNKHISAKEDEMMRLFSED